MKAIEKAKILFPEFTLDKQAVAADILQAYADSHDDVEGHRNLGYRSNYGWNGKEAVKVAKQVIRSYNEFNADVMAKVVQSFGENAKYFFAREGSVAVYVESFGEHDIVPLLEVYKSADELHYQGAGEFRIWWD